MSLSFGIEQILCSRENHREQEKVNGNGNDSETPLETNDPSDGECVVGLGKSRCILFKQHTNFALLFGLHQEAHTFVQHSMESKPTEVSEESASA